MGVFVTRRCWRRSAILPALDPAVSPTAGAAAQPAVHRPRAVDAVRLRELRAGVRARHHLRAAVQGDQGQAPRLLLRAAAVAADARRDERPRRRRRLAVPDLRPGRSAASGRRRSAASPDPRAQAMSVADPKILVALVSWAIYSFALFARRASAGAAAAPHGCRRSAFVIVLLNFVPVGYFLTRSHNF